MRPWKSILILCLLLVAMVSHIAIAAWSVAAESGMSIAARQGIVVARTAEQVALRAKAADLFVLPP